MEVPSIHQWYPSDDNLFCRQCGKAKDYISHRMYDQLFPPAEVKKYLSEIGKKGGSVKSAAKTRANRLNGKKPKKKRIKPEVKS